MVLEVARALIIFIKMNDKVKLELEITNECKTQMTVKYSSSISYNLAPFVEYNFIKSFKLIFKFLK